MSPLRGLDRMADHGNSLVVTIACVYAYNVAPI